MDLTNLPIHPMLVHFPIALFLTAAGLEAASLIFKREAWHQAATLIYVIAALMSPITAWSGLAEADKFHMKHPVLYMHRNFALITAGFSLASLPVLWFIRSKNAKLFRTVFFVCVLTAVTFVTLAAYNGGRLVYEYGIGVAP